MCQRRVQGQSSKKFPKETPESAHLTCNTSAHTGTRYLIKHMKRCKDSVASTKLVSGDINTSSREKETSDQAAGEKSFCNIPGCDFIYRSVNEEVISIFFNMPISVFYCSIYMICS